jgi:UDP-N-acetylglucosamine 3-dehydrogenase
MGSLHLRVLWSMPEVEVVVAVDPDPDRRAQIERLYRGLATAPTLEAALDAHEVDFAGLAIPAASLPDAALTAIGAGMAVLVEKPMAPDEQRALEVIRAAEHSGVVLAVGHVERFNPAVMALKEKLDEGVLGRVYQIHARRLSPFPNRGAMLGVSLDLATHDIDVMRHLIGSDVARVYAEVERRLPIDQPEDLLCATMRFEDGTTGLLEVNWLTPAKVRELTVTGERGMFVVNYVTQELFHYEHPHATTTPWDALAAVRGPGEGNMTRYALERREPLRVQWETFLDAVRTGTAPAVTGQDGLASMSTARAIQASGRDHVITVPDYRRLAV